jgi:predicted Rossmann fold nucleotide-binding protein DprA/Smf involved in DNA uptake
VSVLRRQPSTIPVIAEQLGQPTDEVMFWVMAMRRYGMIEEVGKAGPDGYFTYTLTEHAREEASA